MRVEGACAPPHVRVGGLHLAIRVNGSGGNMAQLRLCWLPDEDSKRWL